MQQHEEPTKGKTISMRRVRHPPSFQQCFSREYSVNQTSKRSKLQTSRCWSKHKHKHTSTCTIKFQNLEAVLCFQGYLLSCHGVFPCSPVSHSIYWSTAEGMIYAAPSLCSTCTSKCGYPLWPDYGPRSCVVSLRFSHGSLGFFSPGLPINIQNQPEPRVSEYLGSVFQALQATSHVSIAIQSTTLNKQGENGELLC